ncbi:MAG: hypothetical protein JSV89_18390 [Spirochaetaceae bacterium]|nr:MAG: hypothetical protein JSV89_18390 [Spirochaetaceae bacterium]
MNNDQIKERLLQIRNTEEYFEVVLSGKKSKKVNGLYKPESRELVLHNKNFHSDNELMYTAIHEYAHHLQFTDSPVPISTRAHTGDFWSLFHGLLYDAERLRLYSNPFKAIEDFEELTRRIREKILSVNGELMKELGELLIQAQKLCEKHHTSFTDYLDRVLRIPRTSANTIIKTKLLDIDPRLGYENMKTLTRISDAETRKQAETALLEDMSPDMVKRTYLPTSRVKPVDPLEQLIAEKDRLERQIKRLQHKLEEISRKLTEYQTERDEQTRREEEQERRPETGTSAGVGIPPRE